MLLSAQAAVTGDSAAAEQFCADWEREVRAAVPPAQLLTFRASDGWAPLCEFLDTAVPDCPYPRLNNAQQFRMGYTRCRLARSPATQQTVFAFTDTAPSPAWLVEFSCSGSSSSYRLSSRPVCDRCCW